MTEKEKLITTKYRVILPEHKSFSESEVKSVEWPAEPGYVQIRDLVAPILGGKDHYLERVAVLSSFDGGAPYKPLDMFVDELGLPQGLPRNELGTTQYRRAAMMGRSGVPVPNDPEVLSFIVGPVILFDRRIWF